MVLIVVIFARAKCMIDIRLKFHYHAPPHAPVAQLDRVHGYEPCGREFESLRARQFKKKHHMVLFFKLESPWKIQNYRRALRRSRNAP